MNFSKTRSISLFLVFLSFSLFVQANDFTTIYQRMYDEYLTNPGTEGIDRVLNEMSTQGSFSDINYTTKEGTPREHAIRLASMAAAYKNPANKYYNSINLRSKYLAGLQFWITTNHNASNWWFRFIAYPKEISKGVVLMAKEIKSDTTLYRQTIQYLRWSFENSNAGKLTGANGADIIIGSMTASILTENHNQMLRFQSKMDSLLTIQDKGEGIEPDYMFAQHSGKGRQLYLLNYGKEYVNSAIYFLEFCNNTQYAAKNSIVIQDLFINGVQWLFFSNNFDPNQAGRFNSSDRGVSQIESLSKRVLALNTPRKAELEKVNDRIKGENSLSGNRMFWRFDYMVNRRTNYMTTTRMSSTRTVGSEAGNGAGEFNYYSGNGTNYIFVTGKEYNADYFKNFNNRQFPGITAEQDNEKLPIPNWGENAMGGSSFAGGVSDSTYGACGMMLKRRGLSANKAWFYFDEEYVCLGAGINEENGKAAVYTTMNQSNLSGSTQYSVKGKISELKAMETLESPEWILQGKIGYFNLDPTATILLSESNKLFSANIDHGNSPKNKSYAYIVKPGVSSVKDATTYLSKNPIRIISNTDKIQAVNNKNLNLTEVIFYDAGTLQLDKANSITVDTPCAILLNEKSGKITLSNPNCESNNPIAIHVVLKLKNKSTTLDFQLPIGAMSGSSINKFL